MKKSKPVVNEARKKMDERKLFEDKFEDFIKECEYNDSRTFLQKLFIRNSRVYWNSDNRKIIAKMFFIKGLQEVKNDNK